LPEIFGGKTLEIYIATNKLFYNLFTLQLFLIEELTWILYLLVLALNSTNCIFDIVWFWRRCLH